MQQIQTQNQERDRDVSECGDLSDQECQIETQAPGQAPKRPLSPFIFYSQDARRTIKKANPELHSKQIMKIV